MLELIKPFALHVKNELLPPASAVKRGMDLPSHWALVEKHRGKGETQEQEEMRQIRGQKVQLNIRNLVNIRWKSSRIKGKPS